MIVAARFPAPCVGTLAVIAVTRRGWYATTPEKRVEELNPSCAAGRFFSQRPVKTIYRSIDEYTTASANLAAKAQRQAGNGVSPILRPVPLPEGGTDMRAADCTRPLEREGLMRRKRAGGGRSARRFDEGDVETELRRGYSGTARRKGRKRTTKPTATAPHLYASDLDRAVDTSEPNAWLANIRV